MGPSTCRCARAKARWCRSRDLNPDAAEAAEDFKSPASTSSATPARDEYTTGGAGAGRPRPGGLAQPGQDERGGSLTEARQGAQRRWFGERAQPERRSLRNPHGERGSDRTPYPAATNAVGAVHRRQALQSCGHSRPSARPQRALREGQRCALEDVGLTAAHLGEAEGAAGLPGDQGAGEDHVLAPLLDARQAAALFVGESRELDDRGVDVGQAEHVTVDKLGAVLAQAELVGHERGVGAGHAHGAAHGAAHRGRHAVRDRAADERREPAELFRRGGSWCRKRSVRRTTPISRLRTNSGFRPAAPTANSVLPPPMSVSTRGPFARPASSAVPPRKARAPSSSPPSTRAGKAKSRSTPSRKPRPSAASRRTLVATSRRRAGP